MARSRDGARLPEERGVEVIAEYLPLLNDDDRTAFLIAAGIVWFIVLAFILAEHPEDDD